MVIRIKMGWFLFVLAQVLRSWSYATLAFVQAETPRRPSRCSLGRRLVDFSGLGTEWHT